MCKISVNEAKVIAGMWTDLYSKTFVQEDSIDNVKEFENPTSNTRVLKMYQ